MNASQDKEGTRMMKGASPGLACMIVAAILFLGVGHPATAWILPLGAGGFFLAIIGALLS